MKFLKPLFFNFFVVIIFSGCQNNSSSTDNVQFEYSHRIPAGENSWIMNDQNLDSEFITQDGVRRWNGGSPIKMYFRTSEKGNLKLGLNLKSTSENVALRVSLNGEKRELSFNKIASKNVYLGDFEVTEAGYQELLLETIGDDRDQIIEINEVLVAGQAAEGEVNFVKDNFHFGRRGPSVHLRFDIPENKEILYYYSEVEVPVGEDVIGSYIMANGFSDGYFGIQVNSEDERRILFSVWSPYDTQDPNEIPEDYRITLLKKGEEVYSGKFGNEGSGGQSYKVFNWKSDTTYKFLLKGEPAENNNTDYTAYFFAPETGEWELIASFRRPYTDNYLRNFYSFLENFKPSTGNISRKAHFKNQWVYSQDGMWQEITSAKFTADATAQDRQRLDYAGGVDGKSFFLKNCGFFDHPTTFGKELNRAATLTPPDINLDQLK